MKQITLNRYVAASAPGDLCLWGTVVRWTIYGVAMAFLWQVAGSSELGRLAVWLAALMIGARLIGSLCGV